MTNKKTLTNCLEILQKMLRQSLCVIFLLTTNSAFAESKFTVVKKPLPDWVVAKMKKHSWREGCPVPMEDLTYLYLKHWGYDGKIHDGRLVVHKKVADEMAAIFKTLFEIRFLIEKMKLIEDYKGSDDASMADNNTSAFNCREVTGKPGVFSKHSFGLAIDINPLMNPYIFKNEVFPTEGKKYGDRTKKAKGMILKGDVVQKAFVKRGWIWGGDWRTVKDYQHFQYEKMIDCEFRRLRCDN
ncbi:M15 family metallopeptidase [bacterium]|nr:M15 family metallopeptidase [bacterium]